MGVLNMLNRFYILEYYKIVYNESYSRAHSTVGYQSTYVLITSSSYNVCLYCPIELQFGGNIDIIIS